MKLAHGTHAKLSKAPGLRCSARMGVSVRGMGNSSAQKPTRSPFSSLPWASFLGFSHSYPFFLSQHLECLHHTAYAHTLLELNQKSMLSMVSQYLIKQSLCPSWQVMHFTALTHTSRHPDSLYLTHTRVRATHTNN